MQFIAYPKYANAYAENNKKSSLAEAREIIDYN